MIRWIGENKNLDFSINTRREIIRAIATYDLYIAEEDISKEETIEKQVLQIYVLTRLE